MKCQICGHPIENHTDDAGCMHPSNGGKRAYCDCVYTPAEVEREAWKAEAMAARTVIDKLILMTEWYDYKNSVMEDALFKSYLADRVKDDEQ